MVSENGGKGWRIEATEGAEIEPFTVNGKPVGPRYRVIGGQWVEVFDPCDYGASPDASPEVNSRAFQAALDAATPPPVGE